MCTGCTAMLRQILIHSGASSASEDGLPEGPLFRVSRDQVLSQDATFAGPGQVSSSTVQERVGAPAVIAARALPTAPACLAYPERAPPPPTGLLLQDAGAASPARRLAPRPVGAFIIRCRVQSSNLVLRSDAQFRVGAEI
eukprot:2574774-Rhodomonas_salina.4